MAQKKPNDKKTDWLKAENCNKTHCKSCIFHPDPQKQLKLSVERYSEIIGYLIAFESSHECHHTKLTCYGALEVQARTLAALGIIDQPSVESFLKEAAKILNFE